MSEPVHTVLVSYRCGSDGMREYHNHKRNTIEAHATSRFVAAVDYRNRRISSSSVNRNGADMIPVQWDPKRAEEDECMDYFGCAIS